MTTKSDETGADDLDQSRLTHLVGYASTRASITMRRVFARHLGPLDLKVVEFSILMLVAANPRSTRNGSVPRSTFPRPTWR